MLLAVVFVGSCFRVFRVLLSGPPRMERHRLSGASQFAFIGCSFSRPGLARACAGLLAGLRDATAFGQRAAAVIQASDGNRWMDARICRPSAESVEFWPRR